MKFRELLTDRNTLILAGKSAQNNEELIAQVQPDEIVLHTDEAGSPFVNIKGNPRWGDIKQAAIFCATYSKDWKKNKKDVWVHKFKGKDVYKDLGMKTGTFGVNKFKRIKVRKKEIERFLKGRDI
ncbi:DUF814 domain-containing protein [Candidatus Pacearchaeota archaeon]|nr:DUF814 domain-containing protein [Candidatus Pacearchaeota archaeon]